MSFIVLRGNLSENEEAEDAIPGSHPETDARRTNPSLIFLSLFISWNRLLFLFPAEGATMATYKKFCSNVRTKCEPTLPSHVKFYTQNIYQMRKTRIEVRADIVAHADTCEGARLTTDDWQDETIDMADSNNEADINCANVDLVKFGVYNKTLLANNIRKTCRKWAVKDYTNSSEIKVIILLIMNLRAENANHVEDSLLICHGQVAKFDCPDTDNIDNINKDIVSS